MNFIYISPEFPVTGTAFITQLRAKGVTVLGIGESPYDGLPMELRNAMTEYYRVFFLQDYDQCCVQWPFTFRTEKSICWSPTMNLAGTGRTVAPGFSYYNRFSARRYGTRKAQVANERRRSAKRGSLLPRPDADHPRRRVVFYKEVGYPVIAKPDISAGASQTYKFMNEEELLAFLPINPMWTCLWRNLYRRSRHYDGIVDAKGKRYGVYP